MKLPSVCSLLLLLLPVFTVSCESTVGLRQAWQERVKPTYQVHDVETTEREAYHAARRAVERFGFRVTGGGASQGYLTALNAVNPGGPGQRSHQTSLRVKFGVSTRGPGMTEVSALFSEIEDNPTDPRNGATEVPLKESPLYEVFFRYLDEALAGPKA